MRKTLTVPGILILMLATVGLARTQIEKPAPAKKNVWVDSYGDPLPDGAIARLGTARFRHGFNSNAIAFSPGGKVLASLGRSPGLCLFEADTGRLLHRLTDARTGQGLAFSPDGKTLFTGHELIDVVTGKEVRQFETRGANAGASAAFSPDGGTIASGGYGDGQIPIVLWDAKTGHELRRLKGHEDEVGSIAFSPTDSKILASGSDDKTVRIWNAATGEQLHRLEGHDQPVLCVVFAPDGKSLASFGEDGMIRLWDAASGKRLHQMKSDQVRFGRGAFSPDGKLLASAGYGGAICLWNPATGKKLRQWQTDFSGINSLAFAPDGKTVASASSCAICRWDVETGKEINPAACHRANVMSLQFAPDGKTLMSGARDRKVLEWDLASSRVNGRLFRETLGGSPVEYSFWAALELSPDGKILAQRAVTFVPTYKPDPAIRLWDTVSGKEIHALSGHKEHVSALKFSANSKHFASSGRDGVRLWDVTSGKELHKLPRTVAGAIAFAPDGKSLVSCGTDLQLRLWDVASGKELRHWDGGEEIGRTLAFSPDGKLIAGGDAYLVRVWAADSGKELMRLNARLHSYALVFSPSGRILAAGGIGERSTDGRFVGYSAIQMWDMHSGQEIRQILPKQGYVQSLAFSRDGRTLASGGADSAILLWDLTGRADAMPAPLTAKQLDALWIDLRGDAAKADQAIWDLALAPQQSLAFLKERLRPAVPADEKQLTKLLADLDSKNFNARQKAEETLIEMGESAEAALRKYMTSNLALEVHRRVEQILDKRGPDTLRQIRAIAALEQIGTAEARQVLQTLSSETVSPRVRQASDAASGRPGRP